MYCEPQTVHGSLNRDAPKIVCVIQPLQHVPNRYHGSTMWQSAFLSAVLVLHVVILCLMDRGAGNVQFSDV